MARGIVAEARSTDNEAAGTWPAVARDDRRVDASPPPAILWRMPRTSLALRAVPIAAVLAVAALAYVAVRPDPREVVLRVAAAGFVVALGVAAILAGAIPLGWVAFVWRRTVGRRRTPGRAAAFLILVLLTALALAAALVIVTAAQPAPIPAPEA